jgi:prepilin-type N-terminal cleavage/methylation domain-containing protein
MRARATHLVRDEEGLSLIELLVAMALGSIVLTAVMTVFLNGLTGSAKVTDRIDAAQSGRLVADRITTLLQAQVCNSGSSPISDAQATSVTFTANLGDVTVANPTRYQIRWDSATNRIYEDRYAPIVATDGTVTYPTTATQTKLIGTNVTPLDGKLFTYASFDLVNGGVSNTALATPVSSSERQTIVSVTTSLVALPERTKASDGRETTISTQAVVGSADAANPNKGPKC